MREHVCADMITSRDVVVVENKLSQVLAVRQVIVKTTWAEGGGNGTALVRTGKIQQRGITGNTDTVAALQLSDAPASPRDGWHLLWSDPNGDSHIMVFGALIAPILPSCYMLPAFPGR